MARLPDIPVQTWLEDQARRFNDATGHYFDVLDFDTGASKLAADIPPDYMAPGGLDQWQQAEQQRIEEENARAQREEEERRRQQAALEEQQRREQEAQQAQAREQEAMSWAERMGIPTPSQLGEHLQGLWNRPTDNLGTTGALPEAPPPSSIAPNPVQPGQRDATSRAVQSFLDWSGDFAGGAAAAVPEALQKSDEAYRAFQQSPTGMMGGMPGAVSGIQEMSSAFTDPILRGGARAAGGISQEGGSSGIDLNLPVVGRFAPSQEDVLAGVGSAVLDPTNLLLAEGPMTRVLGKGAVPAARLAEEATATAIRRAQGDDLSGILRRAADKPLEAAETYLRGRRPERLPSAIFDEGQAVIPSDVVDQLDIPVKLPTDPGVLAAIRAAGGTIDPERGITVNTIRYHSPQGSGQLDTRGGIFAIAAPPGSKSVHAGAEGALTGGNIRIEGETRFRNPFILEEAPGDRGFEEAVEKLGIRPAGPDPQEIAALRAQAQEADQRWRVQDHRMNEEMRRLELFERRSGVQFPYGERYKFEPGEHPYAEEWNQFVDTAEAERKARYALAQIEDRLRPLEATENLQPWQVRDDIDQAIHNARRVGKEGSSERAQVLKAIVAKYGGEPEKIDELMRVRDPGNTESAWAIRENIVAQNARRQGHDSVLVVRKGQPDYNALYTHPKVQQATEAAIAAQDALDEHLSRQSEWLRSETQKRLAPEDRQGDIPWGEYQDRFNYNPMLARRYGEAVDAVRKTPEWQQLKAQERLLTEQSVAADKARVATEKEVLPTVPHSGGNISELADYRESLLPTPADMQVNPRYAEAEAVVEAAQKEYREARRLFDANPLDHDAQLRYAKAMIELDNTGKAMENVPYTIPVEGSRPGYGIRSDVPRRTPGQRFPGELEGPLPRPSADNPSGDTYLPFEKEYQPPPITGPEDDIIFIGDDDMPAVPHGWDTTGPAMGRAEQAARQVLPLRSGVGAVSGAVPGAIAGGLAGDEDTTWDQRLRNAMLGAAVGGTSVGALAHYGNLGAARAIDSLIKRGAWDAATLASHPQAAERIKTLFGLAAEGLPDNVVVSVPGQAQFLARARPEVRQQLDPRLLSGQITAGEARDMVQRTLGQRFQGAVQDLLADVVTGQNTRGQRAAEYRADAATVLGLPENLRGLIDSRPTPEFPVIQTRVLGPAHLTTNQPLTQFVHQLADDLGVERPVIYIAPNETSMNAVMTHGPGARPTLVMSQGLLQSGLSPVELRGMLTHELAHSAEQTAQRGRPRLRVAQAALPEEITDAEGNRVPVEVRRAQPFQGRRLPSEVPSSYSLTDEERALNAAADARAREAPPRSGYLEEPDTPEASVPFEHVDEPPDLPVDPTVAQRAADLGQEGSFRLARGRQTLASAERRLAEERRVHGLEGPEHDALVANTPLGKQVDNLRTKLAQDALPERPPPPEAKPAPPKGSAPKTVEAGPEDPPDLPFDDPAAEAFAPPPGLGEEVMLPDGTTGKITSVWRQGRRRQANDVVTVLTGDGSSIRANVRDLERRGVTTTRTSPHPGFSTGEGPELPDGRAGGGGGGAGKPPAPPASSQPTPPPPPPSGRPSIGPGSAVEAERLKIRQKNDAIAKGQIKPGPPDEATLGKLEKWITVIRQKLTDRRAPLEALQNYMERSTGKKLTPDQQAHLASRIYEGHAGAAHARLKDRLTPSWSQLSEDEFKWMDDIWEQLDAWDKSEAVRYRAQQESLGKKLPEAKASVDSVRREAEATLEFRRARQREGAAVKEVMSAEAERTRILDDMKRLGIEPEQRPPQEPGKRRVKRETQRLETPEISAAHDRWTKNVIRRETAEARLTDARERIDHELQWARERLERRRTISAETHAENVQSAHSAPSGVQPLDPEQVMANARKMLGDESFNRVKKALDASFNMRNEMREQMVSSGVWSRELADDLMKRFPHYSPIKLLQHMDEYNDAAYGGKTFSVSGNLISRLTEKGTEGARMPPSQALVEMVYKYQEAASRNEVMRRVAGWADHESMQPFVRVLKNSEAAPPGWEAFSARINGEVQRLAVVAPYSDALKIDSAFQAGDGGRILRGLSAPLRAGATALRPAFIVTNAVQDGVAALLRFTVSAPNATEAALGVADLYRGYRASFGMAGVGTRAATGAIIGGGLEATREARSAYDEGEGFSPLKILGAAGAGALLASRVRATAGDRAAVQAMREAGGAIGEGGRWGKHTNTIPTLVKELQGQNRMVRVVNSENDLKSYLSTQRLGQLRDAAGLLWARPLERVGGIVEEAPRIAAFRRAQRQGKTLEESANAARRITADFSAGGSWTKNVNTLIPFLNASTQGMVEDMLMAGLSTKNIKLGLSKEQAVRFGAAMAVLVPGIIATEIWNRTVAPDDYQDVTRFTQDHGIVLMDPNAPEGSGKRGLLFVPTRGMLGSIVTLTKNAMHAYLGDDPRTWDRLAKDTGVAMINHLSPVSADGMGFLQSMTPPLAGTAFELMANYDSFRNQPIVSRSMQSLPVSEQYDDRTSQLARVLSRTNLPLVGGSSPMKIDWALRAFSPGPGEAILGASDALIRATGNEISNESTRSVPRGARDVPGFGSISGRFLRTVGSERQNQAYDRADEIADRNRPDMVAYLERSPDYQNATPDRQRQMLRSMETAILEQSRELAGVTAYETPKDYDLPERYYGVDPGSRLEREISSALAVAPKNRTPEQAMLAGQYRSRINRAWTKANKAQAAESAAMRSYVQASLRS